MIDLVNHASAREQAVQATRARILDVARTLLGERPDAGMADVAEAAGVVRRTVYGHFATREALVRTLAEQAAAEIAEILADADRPEVPADAVWARFVGSLWPLTRRYRVLIALRRGEHGDEIHAALGAVDAALAALIRRGQEAGTFGSHLPAEALGRIGSASVFAVADDRLKRSGTDAAAAAVTSLLVLGVPAARASALATGL